MFSDRAIVLQQLINLKKSNQCQIYRPFGHYEIITRNALDYSTNKIKEMFSDQAIQIGDQLIIIHTLRVHYAHAAANLNSGYLKYAKVARVHYFCTIALRTSRA